MRTKQSEAPFVGTLQEYVEHRKQELDKEQQKATKKDQRESRDYNRTVILTVINTIFRLGAVAFAAIPVISGVISTIRKYNKVNKAEQEKSIKENAKKLFGENTQSEKISADGVQKALKETGLKFEFTAASKLEVGGAAERTMAGSFVKKVGKNVTQDGSQQGSKSFSQNAVESILQGQQQGQQKG